VKTAFMGSDPIALPLLHRLVEKKPGGVTLQAVFTQPDRPTGRGMKQHANPVKRWALEQGLPVLQPARCGADEAAFLSGSGFDLVLVMAYGQLLPRSLLESVPHGFLNLHASLLPRLRGASPIHTAVALGLPRTGVSLMRVVPKMDAGPVADQEVVVIEQEATAVEVHRRLAEACPDLLERALPRLVRGTLEFTAQDDAKVTYCRIIDKEDRFLDFTHPAGELANRVRAFQPWPGTAFPVAGTEVRVMAARETSHGALRAVPGTVLPDPDGGLHIACGTGCLLAKQLQRPGGRPLPAAAFLRGFPIEPGTVLASRPMRPLEWPHPFPRRHGASS